MNACRRLRHELAAGFEEFPSTEARNRWKEHLAMCADCREQWKDMETILQGAGALQEDVRQAMNTVDWDSLSERIADTALTRPRIVLGSVPARIPRPRFWEARWRPVFAGALGGLLIGGAAMYFALRSPSVSQAPGLGVQASGEFIDRVERTVAKRETLDYLSKSQALLLDFVQAPPAQAGRVLQDAPTAQRRRELLSKKRLMNAQLDGIQMAKARDICDQIERLFLELSQISGEMTIEEAARIQRFIEDKKILFRIKLLQRELQESEV
jgi:hypothetical protein